MHNYIFNNIIFIFSYSKFFITKKNLKIFFDINLIEICLIQLKIYLEALGGGAKNKLINFKFIFLSIRNKKL